MTLDQMAAQAVMRAHQIERAVHDPGPWSVRVNEWDEFAARRVLGEDHVTFYALARIERPGTIELYCGDTPVALRLIEESVGETQIVWEFALALASAA
jgi:hypothetical protein